jgi:hypothetical protein
LAYSLKRSKNCNKGESGRKGFLDCDQQKKGVHFFGKGNCKKCTGMKQRRKRRTKKVYCKIKMPIIFIKGSCVETPLYTMCLAGRTVIRDEL